MYKEYQEACNFFLDHQIVRISINYKTTIWVFKSIDKCSLHKTYVNTCTENTGAWLSVRHCLLDKPLLINKNGNIYLLKPRFLYLQADQHFFIPSLMVYPSQESLKNDKCKPSNILSVVKFQR